MTPNWVDRFRARLWFAENYGLQQSATREYRKAIREGRITPATECASCGRTGRMHGHHEDYGKPLEVIWLCPLCHSWRHRYSKVAA